jgi:hypothetical protein
VAALVCFYQPWVSASLPAVGESTLTGVAIARGDASARVDEASFGKNSAFAAGAASSAGAAGASTGAAAAGLSSGGLVLPTRQPTVAAGASTGFSAPAAAPTTAPAPPAAAAGLSSGGLTLPTRVPTIAAGSSAGFSAPTAAATVPSLEIGRQIEIQGPDTLPQTLLYGVPLAAAGVAIFSLIWGRLQDPRDRKYGRWWTVILSVGGTLGVGDVLYKVVTAPPKNDLLSPGTVQGAQWGLWGAFGAFLLCALCLAAAWTSPSGRSHVATP